MRVDHDGLSSLHVCLPLSGFGAAQMPDVRYDREQLQPLTDFRQQHRRTIDGRLCAAAFVQNRKTYTDCTTASNPSGESGRPWCYVEAQAGLGTTPPYADLPAMLYRLLMRLVHCRHGTTAVCHTRSPKAHRNSHVPLTFAASVPDYDAIRAEAKSLRTTNIGEVKGLILKLQKAQQAAEDALGLFHEKCS